jgi:hypothetical protein
MTDDLTSRLRAQNRTLRDMRHEARVVSNDDFLGQTERAHLRPQADAAKEFVQRLEDQSDALAAALKHAANVRRNYADVVQWEAGLGVELDHILSAIDACHDHISTALHRDEASRAQELEVMRLVQQATLQGFG